MLVREFMERLRGSPGVKDVVHIDDGLVRRIAEEELSITSVSGGLPIENIGVRTCTSAEEVFVMFCGGGLGQPDCFTMEMVDDRGVVVGHNVTDAMRVELEGRDDVIWMADDFVIHTSRMGHHEVRMVMHANRLDLDVPEGVDPWFFFPSPGTANMLNSVLGPREGACGAAIVGVNGLERQCL